MHLRLYYLKMVIFRFIQLSGCPWKPLKMISQPAVTHLLLCLDAEAGCHCEHRMDLSFRMSNGFLCIELVTED